MHPGRCFQDEASGFAGCRNIIVFGAGGTNRWNTEVWSCSGSEA